MGASDNKSSPITSTAPDSDYGSDFDSDTEQHLATVLQETIADSGTPLILESIEQDAGNEDLHPVAYVPKPSSQDKRDLEQELETYIKEREKRREHSVVVEYDELSRGAWNVSQANHPLRSASLDPNPEPVLDNDTRSPLERFRKKPKKPLSVTDSVSPAWCELQYWYTLTKHGKKRQTPAMKQGSAVHKKLEEQVHSVVEVEVTTREDMWALKIWNVIQGLRTLRITGMTRELEIWGVVSGEVVNGIIDELTYTRPLEAIEGEDIPTAGVDSNTKGKTLYASTPSADDPIPHLSIADFFKAQGATVLTSDPTTPSPWLGLDAGPPKQVHIIDVKTRGARTLPQGSSLRPTKMQLFLYHRILSSLATGAVDPSILFARYNVNPRTPFTDAFIAQVGGLDFNFRDDYASDASDAPPFESPQDAVAELLAHNSLTQLWDLMLREYQRAIPLVSPASPAISDLVKAEFRRAWDGSVMGSKVFRYDDAEMDAYVARKMQFWRGERKAEGVDIEEAFKCRSCEFAEGCEWRQGKVDEAVEKTRLRKRGRPRKSEV